MVLDDHRIEHGLGHLLLLGREVSMDLTRFGGRIVSFRLCRFALGVPPFENDRGDAAER
jgi:hypothetical protein